MSIFKKEPHFFFNEAPNEDDSFDFSIYCPHPFTNWSLNPSYQPKGQLKQHTLEGFRKTCDKASIRGAKETNFSIYCIGGSTTYCTEIYDFKETWPHKLAKNIEADVFNAGVGGWGTLQSLIRYSAWGPILKPNLTIIYQSKNDLTPFYNGRSEQDSIMPLLDNITLQMSGQMGNSPKAFKKNNNGIASVYTKYMSPSDQGLSRFSEESYLLTKTRYQMMAQLSQTWGGHVLFIPELIRGGAYLPFMNKLHEAMQFVVKENIGSHYFDIRELLPLQDDYFQDKMHFSPSGCDLFSEILSTQIKKIFIN